MVRLQMHGVGNIELDSLESVLDTLFNKKNKIGVATGPNLEQVSGKVTGGRNFVYNRKNEKVVFRARLERESAYYLELEVKLGALAYQYFLDRCQKMVPSVYSSLPKPKKIKTV